MDFNIEYLRSFRVHDFAVFDFAASFVAMYLIGKHFNKPEAFLYATVPLSVLVHYLTGRKTPLTQMVVGPGFYLVKILVIALTFMALK